MSATKKSLTAEELYSKILVRLGELKKARKEDPVPESFVVETQKRIRNYIDQIFEADVKFAIERDLESIFWRDVFYRSFEGYQKRLKKSNSLRTVELLRAYLESTTGFYIRLLNRISEAFSLDILAICSGSLLSSKKPQKSTNAVPESALSACFRCLIHLGDLARYRDIHGEKGPKLFFGATRYYNAAHFIEPTNGNAHNQLAVVATYKNDKIAALYQYYRAILHNFPIAKKNVRLLLRSNAEGNSQRTEISKKDVPYIRFSTELLKIHESLLYESNLHQVPNLENSVATKFQHLLKNRSLGKAHYLAIAMLNISAYHIIKESSPKSESFTCTLMIRLFFQLVEECNRLIHAAGSRIKNRPFAFTDIPQHATEMLPAIRIHIKHLSLNPKLIEYKYTAEFAPVVASGWKAYFSIIQALRSSAFPDKSSHNLHRMLEEDLECLGFTPLDGQLANPKCNLSASRLRVMAEAEVRTRDMINDAKRLPANVMLDFGQWTPKNDGPAVDEKIIPKAREHSPALHSKTDDSDDEEMILLSLPSHRQVRQDNTGNSPNYTKNRDSVREDTILHESAAITGNFRDKSPGRELKVAGCTKKDTDGRVCDEAMLDDREPALQKMVDDIANGPDPAEKDCEDNSHNPAFDESALWSAIPKDLLEESPDRICNESSLATPHFADTLPDLSMRPPPNLAVICPQPFPLELTQRNTTPPNHAEFLSPTTSLFSNGSSNVSNGPSIYRLHDSYFQAPIPANVFGAFGVLSPPCQNSGANSNIGGFSSSGLERFSAFSRNGDGQYHNFFATSPNHST